jgi:hypothetical protein
MFNIHWIISVLVLPFIPLSCCTLGFPFWTCLHGAPWLEVDVGRPVSQLKLHCCNFAAAVAKCTSNMKADMSWSGIQHIQRIQDRKLISNIGVLGQKNTALFSVTKWQQKICTYVNGRCSNNSGKMYSSRVVLFTFSKCIYPWLLTLWRMRFNLNYTYTRLLPHRKWNSCPVNTV